MTDTPNPEELLSDELDEFLGPDEEEEVAQPLDDEGEAEEESPEEDGEEELEDGQEEEPSKPASPMPESWSKEDAKAWAELSPEAQAVVSRREGERDKYLRKVGFEASQTQQRVEGQAREVIAQMHDKHAMALHAYSQQFAPQEPDQRLLYTGNPDDVLIYQRQDAAYRAAHAQQQQLQQEIAMAQQQASSHRNQVQQAERASDAQRLREQLPEWFDPSEGPKLQNSLQSIGSELGYPTELMAEASSTDILALKKAAEWKADAEKYRKLMGGKMEAVRAAKGLPKMARPGAKSSIKQVGAAASEKAWEATKKSTGRTREANFADWAEKSGLI